MLGSRCPQSSRWQRQKKDQCRARGQAACPDPRRLQVGMSITTMRTCYCVLVANLCLFCTLQLATEGSTRSSRTLWPPRDPFPELPWVPLEVPPPSPPGGLLLLPPPQPQHRRATTAHQRQPPPRLLRWPCSRNNEPLVLLLLLQQLLPCSPTRCVLAIHHVCHAFLSYCFQSAAVKILYCEPTAGL